MKLSLMVQNELKKEPSSWNEMKLLPEEEQKQWIRAAAEEMSSHNKNQTWILCDLPAEKKVTDANGCSTPMHADHNTELLSFINFEYHKLLNISN